MPRSFGPANRQLRDAFTEGNGSSQFQWERWRYYRTTTGERVPLLPRNVPYGHARGVGSCSELPPDAAAIAAILTRLSREGRDMRLTIIDWHKEAGTARFRPGRPPLPSSVPEPPFAAVKDALHWAVSTSPEYRLFLEICRARDDPHVNLDDDDFWNAGKVKSILRSMPTMAPAFSASNMRMALLLAARKELDANQEEEVEEYRIVLSKGPKARRTAMVMVLRAAAAGWEEVSAEQLDAADEEFAPSAQPAEGEWQNRLDRFYQIERKWQMRSRRSGMGPWPPEPWPPLDPLLPLSAVTDELQELLQEARDTVQGLAWIGTLFWEFALLRPDTPAQEQLRRVAKASGVEHIAMRLAASTRTTEGYAHALVACMHPALFEINAELMTLMGELGPVFGDDPGKFDAVQEDWLSWALPPGKALPPEVREILHIMYRRSRMPGFSTAAWLWLLTSSARGPRTN